MKKIVLLITIIVAMITGCSKAPSNEKGDIHIYTLNNKDGKVNSKILEDALVENGFRIGINSNIHDGLSKMYKESGFKIYNAISLYHPKISMDLIKMYADSGVFVPMGLTIYQKENETDLHIAVVRADTQAKMLGSDGLILKSLEAEIAKVITTLFPTAVHSYNEKSLKEARPLITKYTLDIEEGDFEDAKEELEESFEDKFAEAGFVMPSYFDFSEEFGDDSPYDFYSTYSICKIEVIKSVSKVKPEAAAFAPCTTMMYKKKGEAKIVMGFPSVYNWMSSAVITDQASVDALMKAQIDFEVILKAVTNN